MTENGFWQELNNSSCTGQTPRWMAAYIQLEPAKAKYRRPDLKKTIYTPVARKYNKDHTYGVGNSLKSVTTDGGRESVKHLENKKDTSQVKNSLAKPINKPGCVPSIRNDDKSIKLTKDSATVNNPRFHAKNYKISASKTNDNTPDVARKKGNVMGAKTASATYVRNETVPKSPMYKKPSVRNPTASAIKSGNIVSKSKQTIDKKQYGGIGTSGTAPSIGIPTSIGLQTSPVTQTSIGTKLTTKPVAKNVNTLKKSAIGTYGTPTSIGTMFTTKLGAENVNTLTKSDIGTSGTTTTLGTKFATKIVAENMSPSTKPLATQFAGACRKIRPSRIPRAIGYEKVREVVQLEVQQIINASQQVDPKLSLNGALRPIVQDANIESVRSLTITASNSTMQDLKIKRSSAVTVSNSNVEKYSEIKKESKCLDVASVETKKSLVLNFKNYVKTQLVDTELPTTSAQASARIFNSHYQEINPHTERSFDSHSSEIGNALTRDRKKLYCDNVNKPPQVKPRGKEHFASSKNVKQLVKSYEMKVNVKTRDVQSIAVSKTNSNKVSVKNIKTPTVPKKTKEFKPLEVGRKKVDNVAGSECSSIYRRNENTINQINFARNVLRNNNLYKQRTNSIADTKKKHATTTLGTQKISIKKNNDLNFNAQAKKKDTPIKQVRSVSMKDNEKTASVYKKCAPFRVKKAKDCVPSTQVIAKPSSSRKLDGAGISKELKVALALIIQNNDKVAEQEVQKPEILQKHCSNIRQVNEIEDQCNEVLEQKSDLDLDTFISCYDLRIQSGYQDTYQVAIPTKTSIEAVKDLISETSSNSDLKIKKSLQSPQLNETIKSEPMETVSSTKKVMENRSFFKTTFSPVRLLKKFGLGGSSKQSIRSADGDVASCATSFSGANVNATTRVKK